MVAGARSLVPGRVCRLLLAAALTQGPASVRADIATDGSVGLAVDLAGPDYEIPAGLGSQSGGNLFHSFERFGIGTGESATFTPEGATGSIDRVLSRVTGGEPSRIDGLLRSTIPGADLYLLNPSGVLFGPDARLDVPASLHVTTADTAEFPNGERFETGAGGSVPALAVAPPEAFGFLSADPAGISIDHSRLIVEEGESISLVGGDLDIEGRRFQDSPLRELVAPAGRLDLVSVGSPGRVAFTGAAEDPPVLDGFTAMGDVTFSGGWASTRGTTGVGRIFLRGGAIVLEDAAVESDSRTAHDAGSVDIEADSLQMTDSLVGAFATNRSTGNGGSIRIRADEIAVEAIDARSRIEVSTAGPGRGGSIDIEATDLTLESGPGEASINASSTGTGDAGSIDIRARDVRIEPGSYVGAATFLAGPARAGTVRIQAEELSVRSARLDAGSSSEVASGTIDIDAERVFLSGSTIWTHAFGPGVGGRIAIDAGELRVETSEVSATNWRDGDAGEIEIRANELLVTGAGSILDASVHGPGAGGRIAINAERAEFTNGGTASAATFTTGNAGEVTVEAGELRLAAGHLGAVAAGGTGNAGTVRVDAERVLLQEGATLIAATWATGAAGAISVRADELRLEGESALRVATFNSESPGGGSIEVDTGLLSLDGSSLDAGSYGRVEAGNITVAADRVELSRSAVFVHSLGDGDSGHIAIDADQILVDDSSEVSGTAWGLGDGGTIAIRADALRVHESALFVETHSPGDAGSIDIFADAIDLTGSSRVGARSYDGGRGGRIDLAGERIVIADGSEVRVRAFGPGDAGELSVRASESITITGADTDLEASSFVDGDAGRIEISAPDIRIDDDALVSSSVRGLEGSGGAIRLAGDRIAIRSGGLISTSALGGGTGTIELIASESLHISSAGGEPLSLQRLVRDGVPGPSGVYAASLFATGPSGAVSITAPLVEVADGGIVATTTLGPTDAGPITIDAERVVLRDGGLVDSSSVGAGAAGAVWITAQQAIEVTGAGADGAPSRVRSAAAAGGAGGEIAILAPDVRLDGGAIATTTVGTAATGVGGAIVIDAERVQLTGGGRIDSSTFSNGDGGRIRVTAREQLGIEGAETGIFAETGGPGVGGGLEIEAGTLRVSDGGVISSRSGSEVAGAVHVFADAVAGGFVPALRNPAGGSAGAAGDVRIAANRFALAGGAIDTAADRGAGGNVGIRVAGPATLSGGAISASVGSGSGGNVLVDAPLLVVEGSRIVAQADAGEGGNIALRTDLLLVSNDSEISASARLGVDGTVAIDSPDVDLAASLTALPAVPLDATDLLRQRCGNVRSDALGSFVVRGRSALPASYAEGLLLALLPAAPSRPTAAAPAAPATVVAIAGAPLPRFACATASY